MPYFEASTLQRPHAQAWVVGTETLNQSSLVFEIRNKTYLFLHVLIVIERKTKSSVCQFRRTFLYSSENILMQIHLFISQ